MLLQWESKKIQQINIFFYQNNVQIWKKLEKTEKKNQNKIEKEKSSDKIKSFDKKQFWKYEKIKKLTLSFNQIIL